MKNDHDALDALLRRWQPPVDPASDFSAGVWRRLEAQPAPIFAFWLPLAAGIAVLLGTALGAGSALALRPDPAARTAAAYVRSVDAVQMTARHLH